MKRSEIDKMVMEVTELRAENGKLRREVNRLRDTYEPEIRTQHVATAGPGQILVAGYTADGRWMERVVPA